MLQTVSLVLVVLATVAGVALLTRGVVAIVRQVGVGRPAPACPFCTTMLSDGAAANGDDVEVLDVAQLLLAGVRRGQER